MSYPIPQKPSGGQQFFTVIKWIVSIYCFLNYLFCLFTLNFVPAIGFFLAALLSLPPLRPSWVKWLPFMKYRAASISIIISLFIVSAANVDLPDFEKISNQQHLSGSAKPIETDTIIVAKAENRPSKKEKSEQFKKSCLSGWDGSCRNLVKYVKDRMDDPSSFKHVDTQFWNMDSHAVVVMKFRGKNAFGATVLNTIKCKVSWSCEILEVIEVL